MFAIKGFVVVALAGPMVAGVAGLVTRPIPPTPAPPPPQPTAMAPARAREPMPEIEQLAPRVLIATLEEPTALEVLLLPEPERDTDSDEEAESVRRVREAHPPLAMPENLKLPSPGGKPAENAPLPVPAPGSAALLGCGAFALTYRRR